MVTTCKAALADVCSLIADCPHNTAAESDTAYGFAVGTKAIDNGRIDFAQARPVSAETYATWTGRAVPEPGDLILCREAPVGPAAIVPASPKVCLGQRTVLLRPNRQRVVPEYLLYALLSPRAQASLRELSEGSTVAHLNVAEIRRFEVSLPPLEEQRRIVGVLGALDDKIDSNRRLAGLLEETATTLFRARFVDFVGVEEFEDSELGSIPAGWSVGQLGSLVDVTMGQSPPGSSYSEDPAAGMFMVQGMGGFGERFPSSTTYTSAPTKRVRAGATLMTVRAPVGAVNVTRVETCAGRGVAGIVSEFQAFGEFLIRSLSERWASQESGTIFPAVNRRQVVDLPVVVPPRAPIADYDRTASPLVESLAALHDESLTLASIRDALLPKLISGDARVPDTRDPAEVIEPMVA